MRVLVVDDEEHLRRVMRLTLEASGYDVAEASDGEEALRLFGDGESFDAMLLDQRMPGLDGLETLRRMKTRNADACIIMVTAYATVELAVDAMKLGATDFVRKPMTPETLRHAVAAALAKRGPQRCAPVPPPNVRRSGRHRSHRPRSGRRMGSSFAELNAPTCVRGTAIERPPFRRQARHRGCRSRGRSSRSTRRPWRRSLESAERTWVGRAVSGIAQAENALINYLWSEAALPEGGRLVIDRVSGPMLDEAMDWSGD